MRFDPSLPEEGVNVSPTHPLREAAVLVAGVLAVVVATAVALGWAVDLLVPHISPAWEARLFSGWFAAEGDGDPETAEQRAALLALLARLERHWPDRPYAFDVSVWDESEPNAVALPGGMIAVTSGLLDLVESENELAFVLGHELGHFRNRDHLRGLGRGIGFSLVLAAIGVGGGGGATQLASVAGELTNRGFGRDQESRADRFALELVAAEYGSAAGVTDFFEHVSAAGAEHDSRLAGYLSSHPLHADRIQALRSAARAAGWPLRGERRELPDALWTLHELPAADLDARM